MQFEEDALGYRSSLLEESEARCYQIRAADSATMRERWSYILLEEEIAARGADPEGDALKKSGLSEGTGRSPWVQKRLLKISYMEVSGRFGELGSFWLDDRSQAAVKIASLLGSTDHVDQGQNRLNAVDREQRLRGNRQMLDGAPLPWPFNPKSTLHIADLCSMKETRTTVKAALALFRLVNRHRLINDMGSNEDGLHEPGVVQVVEADVYPEHVGIVSCLDSRSG